jgi:hypothetical protein
VKNGQLSVQTFLPFPDYEATASVLDYRRLGKQRVECKQIVMALLGESSGWINHPATRMWKGYCAQLIEYAIAMCDEWKARGYEDNLKPYFLVRRDPDFAQLLMPPWMDDPAFHESHRSNLTRKLPEHYSKFWPDTPNNLPYVWPV